MKIKEELGEYTTKNELGVRHQGAAPHRETAPVFQPTLLSPFGPCIYYNTIRPECFNELEKACEIARKEKKDVSDTLAGVIKEQYDVEPFIEKPDDVYHHLNDHCHEYLSLQSNIRPDLISVTPHDIFQHEGMWVNYQKPLEYQPEHAHNGFVSYVIYLENPITEEEAADNIYDKRVRSDTRPSLAGKVNFHYGESLKLSENNFYHFPQQGDIIMFPSWLGHSVHPFFKEGVERISVAGNISLINNTNEIV